VSPGATRNREGRDFAVHSTLKAILSGLKTLLETGKPLAVRYPVAEGVRD
jgi:hypothetical protein